MERSIVPIVFRLLAVIANFWLIPVLNQSLNPEEFSRWMVIMSILGFSSFLDMGIGTTFRIVFHSKDSYEKDLLYREMQRKLSFLTLILLFLVVVSGFFLNVEFLVLPVFLILGVLPKSVLSHLYVIDKSYTASTLMFLPSLIFAVLAILVLNEFSMSIMELSLMLGTIYFLIYLCVYFYHGQQQYFTLNFKMDLGNLSPETNISFVLIQLSAAFLLFFPGWYALNFMEVESSASFQIQWKLLTLFLSLFSIINARYLNLFALQKNKKETDNLPIRYNIYSIGFIFSVLFIILSCFIQDIIDLWMQDSLVKIDTKYFSTAMIIFMFSGIVANKLSAARHIRVQLFAALSQVIILIAPLIIFDLPYLVFAQLYTSVILIGYLILVFYNRKYEESIV